MHVYWWIIGSAIGLCMVVIVAFAVTLIRFVSATHSLTCSLARSLRVICWRKSYEGHEAVTQRRSWNEKENVAKSLPKST